LVLSAKNVQDVRVLSLSSDTELNCVMTEHEVRLCEFALSILCDNDDEMKFSVFKTLRDKLRKLGYEYH